jgi:SNF2 family DNA or RNA helicase
MNFHFIFYLKMTLITQESKHELLSKKLDIFKIYLDYSLMEHKQYQYEGVKWCLNNELFNSPCEGVNGGIIADEMGLGKTIMMIGTFITNILPKTLIVLPVVLLDQWYNQILKTTGHKAIIYHGKNKKIYDLKQLQHPSIRIVIATYHAISITRNESNNILHQLKWDRLVFDEAHHLRNKNTSVFKGCQLLNGKIRWLISGTPIQNKKDDFYNLCACIKIPNEFYKKPTNLLTIAKHFILKRSKKQVGINLPNINIKHKIINWSHSPEMKLAKEIHSSLHLFERMQGEPYQKNTEMLSTMMHAKKICAIPNMISVYDLHKMIKNGIITNNIQQHTKALNYSSKLDAVVKTIIERKNNGNGKLIFCQFHKEIDTIYNKLIEGGITRIATFDGRTPCYNRMNVLSQDNEALIIQIQTGCEGLNLQDKFNEIYFVSPHWNPSVEDQSIGRCHRIGQTKSVSVYKFEMEGLNFISLDDYINNIQEQKRNITQNLFTSNTN